MYCSEPAAIKMSQESGAVMPEVKKRFRAPSRCAMRRPWETVRGSSTTVQVATRGRLA